MMRKPDESNTSALARQAKLKTKNGKSDLDELLLALGVFVSVYIVILWMCLVK